MTTPWYSPVEHPADSWESGLAPRGHRLGDQWVAWIRLTNALGRRNPGAGLWPLRSRLGACFLRPL